jgi:hypothetical protein
VTECRRRGLSAASDPELHAAFDITYDYDGRQELEEAWRGQSSLEPYLHHLQIQEALYPADAVKLRFLENHDQVRAAASFGRGARLRSWTLYSMLLPGTYMAYMGEEFAMERRIGLFDREPMLEAEGDPSFRPFFAQALSLAKKIKSEAPFFDAKLLAQGIVLIERRRAGASGEEAASYSALLNLDGRSGWLSLPSDLALGGKALLGKAPKIDGDRIELAAEPLILKN